MSDLMNKVTNVDIIKVAGGGHIVLKVVKKDRIFNGKLGENSHDGEMKGLWRKGEPI